MEALDAMAEVEVVLADRLAASTGTSQHVHGDRQSAHISGILREQALEPSCWPRKGFCYFFFSTVVFDLKLFECTDAEC